MKNDFSMIVFALLQLVFASAVECLFPKILSTGLPALLSVAIVFSERGFTTWTETIFIAIIAGAMEDALSGFPPGTSISFFALAVFAIRKLHLPIFYSQIVFPLYFSWMWIWGIVSGCENFLRMVFILPVGFLTTLAFSHIIGYLSRKAGLR
jgi:hypothetical protein